MSETSTPVTTDHFRYVAERTIQEDSFLRRLKSEARAAGIPPIWISGTGQFHSHIVISL